MPQPRAAAPANARDQGKRDRGDYNIQDLRDRNILNRRRIEVGLPPKPVNQTKPIIDRLTEPVNKKENPYRAEYFQLKKQESDMVVEFGLIRQLAEQQNVKLPKDDDEVPEYYRIPKGNKRLRTAGTDVKLLIENLALLDIRRAREKTKTGGNAETKKMPKADQLNSNGDAHESDDAADDSNGDAHESDDADDDSKGKGKGRQTSKKRSLRAETDSDDDETGKSLTRKKKPKIEEGTHIKQEPRDDEDADGLSELIGHEESDDKEEGSAFPEVTDNYGQRMKAQDYSSDDFAPLWSLLDHDARDRLFDTQRLHDSDNARDTAALESITLLQSRSCQPSELKVYEGLSFTPTSSDILNWTLIEKQKKQKKLKKLYTYLASPRLTKDDRYHQNCQAAVDAVADQQNPDGMRVVFAILVARHYGPDVLPFTTYAPLDAFLDGLRSGKQKNGEPVEGDITSNVLSRQEPEADIRAVENTAPPSRVLESEKKGSAGGSADRRSQSALDMFNPIPNPESDTEEQEEEVDDVNKKVVEKMTAFLEPFDSEEEAELSKEIKQADKDKSEGKEADNNDKIARENKSASESLSTHNVEAPITAVDQLEAQVEPQPSVSAADSYAQYNNMDEVYDEEEDESMPPGFW